MPASVALNDYLDLLSPVHHAKPRFMALAYIGTGATVLGDVNWLGVLSAGAFGAVTAMLLALTGLPEVEEQENIG